MAFSQTAIQSDNFDSYAVGGTAADQSSVWDTCSGSAAYDAFVSDSLSSSASNSMHV
jgi:hypothetical protein